MDLVSLFMHHCAHPFRPFFLCCLCNINPNVTSTAGAYVWMKEVKGFIHLFFRNEHAGCNSFNSSLEIRATAPS